MSQIWTTQNVWKSPTWHDRSIDLNLCVDNIFAIIFLTSLQTFKTDFSNII